MMENKAKNINLIQQFRVVYLFFYGILCIEFYRFFLHTNKIFMYWLLVYFEAS